MVLNKNGGATSVVYPAGQTVTKTSLIAAGDISLINVAFDANGGEGTMTDMSVIKIESQLIITPAASIAG